MHLSQLEKVEGTDSRSLAVPRAHSKIFVGLILVMRWVDCQGESFDDCSCRTAVRNVFKMTRNHQCN